VNLLQDLQEELGLALLFIAHDLAVVEHISDSVLVLHRGKIVESGPSREVLEKPKDPYTRELLAAVPDRWNRLPARLFAPGGAGTVQSVAEAVVEAGLARVEIDGLMRPCLRPLLALEARARREKLGLWADPAFAVAAATDHGALATRAGEVLLVEGRVSGVNTAATRAYVNFGSLRTLDFAATVARANLGPFEKGGAPLSSLTGKVVRVRGMLETHWPIRRRSKS
jgi:hypothetical protein